MNDDSKTLKKPESMEVPLKGPRPNLNFLRGNMRDINAASRCKHLYPTMLVALHLVSQEVETATATPGQPEGKRTILVPRVAGRTGLGFNCKSPQVHEYFVGPMVPEIGEQIPLGNSEVTLDFCRMRPWYEPASKAKP